MKFLIAFIAFSVIAASFASANPIQQEQEGQGYERANRVRRVTCDLLSVSTKIGSLNHAACAAHCLAMRKGYRGGRCIHGVCNCRK